MLMALNRPGTARTVVARAFSTWATSAMDAARCEFLSGTQLEKMIQPLVELYGVCMVVLKVSWCGINRKAFPWGYS
jgi:hypothetical protein